MIMYDLHDDSTKHNIINNVSFILLLLAILVLTVKFANYTSDKQANIDQKIEAEILMYKMIRDK